ncbi:DUF2269 domain-containing protein [Arthrobacter sp. FW306-05-C]|uniref:DUF2269 domain-containing protein n=1 Tax=Arthrobacter sp. FW306-05-C TaxID=2879620 RepID=UPI001F46A81E|nr:DUF2269 domain-containing protein [Arthrobacter sp. FW306-05-C]UKA68372.1 DUF2269 domain-containing protein [Arthrobacter sp. FW306-05-C]
MKRMPPGVRKVALTVHIISSVGWLGAIAAFLVMAIAGLTSSDAQLARTAYVGMNLVGWMIIFPLCLASLISGVIQGLGTVWGLFRHYWVLIKLVITALATALLLVHLQPVTTMAEISLATDLGPSAMSGMRIQLVADAGAAILALLVTTVLSVYKPRGLTRHGQRVLAEQQVQTRSVKGARA